MDENLESIISSEKRSVSRHNTNINEFYKLADNFYLEPSVIKSTSKSANNLNYEAAVAKYGKDGVDRYYKSLLDIDVNTNLESLLPDDSVQRKTPVLKKALGYASKALLSPISACFGIYNFVLNKTNNHTLANASLVGSFGELATAGMFALETAYYSAALHIPFGQLFMEELPVNIPTFIETGALVTVGGTLLMNMIVMHLQKKFNADYLERTAIEKDIKKYKKEFYATYKKYSGSFLNDRRDEVSLKDLNAVYMMSSSKASNYMMDSIANTKLYEEEVIPFIEESLGKKVKASSIIHKSPSGVGGATFIPSSLMGKLFKKGVHGYVFVNRKRAVAAPGYIFADYHELSHHAGATSEQMASYYAMQAMDKLAQTKPLEGYDLYTATNRLLSAVGALKKKYSNIDDYMSRLRKLDLPGFVYDSFDEKFDPMNSITPPMYEIAEESSDSKFADLYVSGPYLASKLVEKGGIRTFKNSE